MPQRRKFTQSVPLPEGTEFSAEVISKAEYNPGRLNISQGILEKDITIQATPALPKNCIISTTLYSNQDIILNIWNNAETQITRSYINPEFINLTYGIKYSIELRAHEGYEKSELINIIENRIYMLNRNINVSAISDAYVKQCEIVLLPTQHQTITVNTDISLTIESDTEDEIRVVVPYWTKYLPEIESDIGYNPGTLNSIGEQIVCKTNINFTPYYSDDDESGYVLVRSSSAIENKHRVTIYKYNHQKIQIRSIFNNRETIITEDVNPIQSTSTYNVYELFDTSIYFISLIPNEGYQSLYPILRYVENGETHTIDVLDPLQEFILDKNIEVLAYSEASISYHTITLNQSQNQTMYLTSGDYEDITGSVNLIHNSEFTIRVEVKDSVHFNPGEAISSNDDLTLIGTNLYKGIITGDNVVYVTPAILK